MHGSRFKLLCRNIQDDPGEALVINLIKGTVLATDDDLAFDAVTRPGCEEI